VRRCGHGQALEFQFCSICRFLFLLRVFRKDTSCDVVEDLAVGTEVEVKLCALVLGRSHGIDRVSEFL
jgi:hypothetical protein